MAPHQVGVTLPADGKECRPDSQTIFEVPGRSCSLEPRTETQITTQYYLMAIT